MELRHLRHFVTIAEERSLTRSQYPQRDGAVRAPLAVAA
jgi:hypothetical protein